MIVCVGCGREPEQVAVVDDAGGQWCADCVDSAVEPPPDYLDEDAAGFMAVLYGEGQSPALGSNQPSAAAVARAKKDTTQAVTEAARLVVWARRHGAERVVSQVLEQQVALMEQDHVFVVKWEQCGCLTLPDSGKRWHLSEAGRDRYLDEYVAEAEEGDVLTTYTLPLPKVLGDLTDESIWLHVEDVEPVDAEGWRFTQHRYGTCPVCGRTDNPPSDKEALDRIAQAVKEGVNVTDEVAMVLRTTGRLRGEPVTVDEERWLTSL